MDGPSLESASNAIHSLLNHYHDEVVPALGRLDDPDDHFVEVALLTRSPPLVEAALTLAEAGFGRETMMLNRPLFELMLDAGWSSTNRALANDRFLAHARYTQNLQRRVFERYPELPIDVHPESLPADELANSKKLFGRYAERSWTGLNVKKRVEAFEGHLDSSECRQLWFVFDILHALNNAELHPSSWSLARALRRVPNDEGGHKLQFRHGPEPEFAPFALGFTWWIFLKQLDLAHKLLGRATVSLQETADVGAELLGLVGPNERD